MFSSLDRVTQLEEDAHFYARFLPQLPEQRELIERCLAHRKAQLAIERLGVPFDSCVVLADPRREFRPTSTAATRGRCRGARGAR